MPKILQETNSSVELRHSSHVIPRCSAATLHNFWSTRVALMRIRAFYKQANGIGNADEGEKGQSKRLLIILKKKCTSKQQKEQDNN